MLSQKRIDLHEIFPIFIQPPPNLPVLIIAFESSETVELPSPETREKSAKAATPDMAIVDTITTYKQRALQDLQLH